MIDSIQMKVFSSDNQLVYLPKLKFLVPSDCLEEVNLYLCTTKTEKVFLSGPFV